MVEILVCQDRHRRGIVIRRRRLGRARWCLARQEILTDDLLVSSAALGRGLGAKIKTSPLDSDDSLPCRMKTIAGNAKVFRHRTLPFSERWQ